MRKISIALNFLLLFSSNIIAQNKAAQQSAEDDYFDESVFSKLSPSNPTAASLGKYGTHQVAMNNGLVPINITLYEIKSGDLTVPIKLCYHGGGIMVDQEATWVGLGWDLDFGGSIVRTVYGSDDKLEDLDNVPSAEEIIREKLSKGDNSFFTTCDRYATGIDHSTFQPDLYSYKIGGQSGTFFTRGKKGTGGFDFDSIYSTSCLQMKMSKATPLRKGGLIMPDGTLYQFNKTETTIIKSSRRYILPYTSAFYVTNIISPSSRDTICYSYQNGGVSEVNFRQHFEGFEHIDYQNVGMHGSEDENWNNRIMQGWKGYRMNFYSDYYIQKVQTVKPERISFRGGRLVFNLDERKDLVYCDAYYTPKKLRSIDVEAKMDDGTYKTIKSIYFHYSYYEGSGKLRLDSITENGMTDSGTVSKLVASFTYYGQNEHMPKTGSFTKDFWGFYNGRGNSTDIPYSTLANFNGYSLIGNADRTPDEKYMKYGSLRTITYPTGGYTVYDWEINRLNLATPLYGKMKSCHFWFKPEYTHEVSKNPPRPSDDEPVFGETKEIYCAKDQMVEFTISMEKEYLYDLSHNKYDHCYVYVDGSLVSNYGGKESSYENKTCVNLKKGNHRISIYSNCSNISSEVFFNYFGTEDDKDCVGNVPFAGLRIREITDYEPNGSVQLRKTYDYIKPDGTSSGYLLTRDSDISFLHTSFSVDETPQFLIKTKRELFSSDMERGPKENEYSYEYVTENILDGKDNKILSSTMNKYEKCEDIFISAYTPLKDMSAFRNNILQEIYSYENNQKSLLKRIENYYHKDNRIDKKAVGFIMHTDFRFPDKTVFEHFCHSMIGDGKNIQNYFLPYNYSIDCNWVHLDSTRTTNFYEDGTIRMEKSLYSYDSPVHLQPTKTIQIVGKDTVVTEAKYASDMQGDLYSEMVDKNMLSYLVEGKVSSLNGGQKRLIKGKYNDYSFDHGNLVLSRVSRILYNGGLERLYDYKYNIFGRLIEFVDKNGLTTSIIWDKKQMYPLYVANGIDYISLKNAYDMAEMNSSTIGNAQVTSYTYKPFVGMTSKKEPNGMITRYEYDPLGRLEKTYMDKPNGKSHLLQKIDYKIIKSQSFLK